MSRPLTLTLWNEILERRPLDIPDAAVNIMLPLMRKRTAQRLTVNAREVYRQMLDILPAFRERVNSTGAMSPPSLRWITTFRSQSAVPRLLPPDQLIGARCFNPAGT